MEMEDRYKLYEEFLNKWPRERVETMTLEEYTSAGGKDTFTYWIESRLSDWGSIWGGSAFKFGIFNCASRQEGEILKDDRGRMHDDEYAWYTMYGNTRAEAFANVKRTILTIIDAVRRNDLDTIDSLKMGRAYKWKIAFHYQPDLNHPIVLPVYKFDRECLNRLSIYIPEDASIKDIQELLLDNKPTEMSIYDYGSELWSTMYHDNLNGKEKTEVHGEKYLESPIANYITQFDGQSFTDDELAAILMEEYKKAEPNNQTFAVHHFAILYAPHIHNGNQLSIKAIGSNKFVALLNDGKKIGLYLRERISTPLTCQEGHNATHSISSAGLPYLRALRTKPFMLLAGISGTGKSRIVREMAYKSCPNEGDLRADKTTPGNYLMVEVKPNWHDSSELLGYYSNINSKYILTPFVKFLVKAKKYPHVPFFVCLDEMNLAPVEQYFAEFLSVLETRRMVGGTIKSGALVKKDYLTELGEKEDLTLPANVFIVGTVNMDDTTHQFSRKVIDRAMTIEMNGGNLEDMFGHASDLDYTDNVWTMDSELLVKYVNADEVIHSHQLWADKIKTVLPRKLGEINKCLKGTPFEVSYRVLNELCIYLGVLLDDTTDIDDNKFSELVDKAIDRILLMKILPRIEGDAEMFNLSKEEQNEVDNGITNKLNWLKDICPEIVTADNEMTSKKKLDEMLGRLNSGFTRYWP